jgi:copper chaperone CopZ
MSSESESESKIDVFYARWWVELGIRAAMSPSEDMADCPSIDSIRRVVNVNLHPSEETGQMITIVDAHEWVESAIQACMTGTVQCMEESPDPGFIDGFRPKKTIDGFRPTKTVFFALLARFIDSASDEAEAELCEIESERDEVKAMLSEIEIKRAEAEDKLRKIESKHDEAKANLEDIIQYVTMLKAAGA